MVWSNYRNSFLIKTFGTKIKVDYLNHHQSYFIIYISVSKTVFVFTVIIFQSISITRTVNSQSHVALVYSATTPKTRESPTVFGVSIYCTCDRNPKIPVSVGVISRQKPTRNYWIISVISSIVLWCLPRTISFVSCHKWRRRKKIFSFWRCAPGSIGVMWGRWRGRN